MVLRSALSHTSSVGWALSGNYQSTRACTGPVPTLPADSAALPPPPQPLALWWPLETNAHPIPALSFLLSYLSARSAFCLPITDLCALCGPCRCLIQVPDPLFTIPISMPPGVARYDTSEFHHWVLKTDRHSLHVKSRRPAWDDSHGFPFPVSTTTEIIGWIFFLQLFVSRPSVHKCWCVSKRMTTF